jgi:hypothetical protein
MSDIIVVSKEELATLIEDKLREVVQLSATPEMAIDLFSPIVYLTTNQVAKVCGVSHQTVGVWKGTGQLVPRPTGRAEKYHVEDVRKMVRRRISERGPFVEDTADAPPQTEKPIPGIVSRNRSRRTAR